MLFVDDDQAELLEADVALHERVGADDEVHRAGFDLGELLPPGLTTRGPGQQRHAKARRLQQPRDVQEVLLGQNLGRRHERHLQAVLHRDERRQQRHDRLARADVALQQAVHRLRPLQVVDDFLQRLPLPRRQLERQHAARRFPNPIVDVHGRGLPLFCQRRAPRDHAHLEEKRLLEDQPALRRRREAIEVVNASIVGRKVRRLKRSVAGWQAQPNAQPFRQLIRDVLGQPLQRVVNEPALDLRRDRSGLLVDRARSGRCESSRLPPRRGFRIAGWSAEDRRGRASPRHQRARRAALRRTRRAGTVGSATSRAAHRFRRTDERLEDLEAGAPRRSEGAAQNSTGNRSGLTRLERCDA